MSRLFVFVVSGTGADGAPWKVEGGVEMKPQHAFNHVLEEVMRCAVVQLRHGKAECNGPHRITGLLVEEVSLSQNGPRVGVDTLN